MLAMPTAVCTSAGYSNPVTGLKMRACAPMSVGPMDPVGMTNPSKTNPRNAIAMVKATVNDISVPTMSVSGLSSLVFFCGAVIAIDRIGEHARGGQVCFSLVTDLMARRLARHLARRPAHHPCHDRADDASLDR